MLLVVGGTGTVGSEVLRQLQAKGHEDTRALVRSEAGGEEVRALGAEPVVGDLADQASLERALEGVDKVFFVVNAGPDQLRLETNLVEAIAAKGDTGAVKLSVIGADPSSPVRFIVSHGEIEKLLKDLGVPHTLLRPNDYMSNSFNWAGMIQNGGTVYTPNAEDRIASVDVRDIAAAATAALTEDGHEGKVYELSGAESLTRLEQVQVVADVIGKPIEAVGVSADQARESMLEMGIPAWTVDGLHELMTLYYEPGYAAGTTAGVKEATGREPHSWADFARDHVEVWS